MYMRLVRLGYTIIYGICPVAMGYRGDFADVYEAGEVRLYYLFGISGIP